MFEMSELIGLNVTINEDMGVIWIEFWTRNGMIHFCHCYKNGNSVYIDKNETIVAKGH